MYEKMYEGLFFDFRLDKHTCNYVRFILINLKYFMFILM